MPFITMCSCSADGPANWENNAENTTPLDQDETIQYSSMLRNSGTLLSLFSSWNKNKSKIVWPAFCKYYFFLIKTKMKRFFKNYIYIIRFAWKFSPWVITLILKSAGNGFGFGVMGEVCGGWFVISLNWMSCARKWDHSSAIIVAARNHALSMYFVAVCLFVCLFKCQTLFEIKNSIYIFLILVLKTTRCKG